MEATQTLTTYSVDTAHSAIRFKVRHLGFSKVAGRFDAFDATLHFDPDQLDMLEVSADIQAASVTTGSDQRDTHLRSADFFDADTYPTLSFSSAGVQDVEGDVFTLVGDLTIRDITQRVMLDVVYLGEARDPWGGVRAAFEARTKINRTDFGLTWNTVLESGGLLVGEEVEIILEIQAVKEQE